MPVAVALPWSCNIPVFPKLRLGMGRMTSGAAVAPDAAVAPIGCVAASGCGIAVACDAPGLLSGLVTPVGLRKRDSGILVPSFVTGTGSGLSSPSAL